jgi:hypothetical protein
VNAAANAVELGLPLSPLSFRAKRETLVWQAFRKISPSGRNDQGPLSQQY